MLGMCLSPRYQNAEPAHVRSNNSLIPRGQLSRESETSHSCQIHAHLAGRFTTVSDCVLFLSAFLSFAILNLLLDEGAAPEKDHVQHLPPPNLSNIPDHMKQAAPSPLFTSWKKLPLNVVEPSG